MTKERHVAGIPATERVVVGLCHDLNDQLAAVSAYAFLLKRRGQSPDLADPLQEQLDRLAHSVRLVRSLCRSTEPEVGPVAVSLLAESAGELMRAHPEGAVRFTLPASNGSSNGAGVVRCDWTRALRALLSAAAWVRRGVAPDLVAEIRIEKGSDPDTIVLALASDAPAPADADPPANLDEGVRLEPAGPRSIVVRLASEASSGS